MTPERLKEVEDYIYNNPLLLLTLKQDEIDYVNSNYLIYSTGFEIECGYNEFYNVENFEKIPNIMEVRNDAGEQRYRVEPGVVGILTVFYISQQLKLNSSLQESGIHYHVDLGIGLDLESMYSFILTELDKWNYLGKYNTRGVSNNYGGYWCRYNIDYKTIEFRVGEMTFDYKILIKRIIHANYITKVIKGNYKYFHNVSYKSLDVLTHLNYLKSIGSDSYEQAKKKYNEIQHLVTHNPKKLIKDRVIKI